MRSLRSDMERINFFLGSLICYCDALVLSLVFRPRLNKICLQILAWVFQIAHQVPLKSTISTALDSQLRHRIGEFFGFLRLNQILDTDLHRTMFRVRCDGKHRLRPMP